MTLLEVPRSGLPTREVARHSTQKPSAVDVPVVLPAAPSPWPARMLVAGDVVALGVGAWASLAMRGRLLEPLTGPAATLGGATLALVLAIWLLGHLGFLVNAGLYRPRFERSAFEDVPVLAKGVMYASMADLVVTYLMRIQTPRGLIVVAAFVSLIALIGFRMVGRWLERRWYANNEAGVRTVVVGGGRLTDRILEATVSRPHHGVRVIGVLSDRPPAGRLASRWVGNTDDLATILDRLPVDHILVTAGADESDMVTEAVRVAGGRCPWISVVSPHPDLAPPAGEHDRIGTLPLTHLKVPSLQIKRRIRDGIDRLAAGILLAAAAPVILALALVVKLDSEGPAFFRQRRVGRDGDIFHIVKLRTMVVGAERLQAALEQENEASGPLFKIRRDPRVTRVGRWLRASSLDELPQLWNVVRGDMSLVGPRPATPDEVVRYPHWFKRRLAVRPGITGLWQVSGRADLPFEEAIRLDLSYVEHWSPWLDIQILLKTVGVVVLRRGGY